ncbi:hypothetical protein [Nocardioides acrostichi]|nr:hypothetical protein [Nocardioides acrostichi]
MTPDESEDLVEGDALTGGERGDLLESAENPSVVVEASTRGARAIVVAT